MTDTGARIVAALYDVMVPDWPDELEFYRGLLATTRACDVLEIACGTGRIALHIAGGGVRVSGIDRSAEMIEVARVPGPSFARD